ncbi:unnamed protein product, partial [Rotaria sordida]
ATTPLSATLILIFTELYA